jgi:hypothetical protein
MAKEPKVSCEHNQLIYSFFTGGGGGESNPMMLLTVWREGRS